MQGFISKKGEKWYIVVNEVLSGGKRKKKWISTGTNDKKTAENMLIEYLHKRNIGDYVAPDKMTFVNFLEIWMEEYVKNNCEKTTICGYKTVIDKHIVPKIGNILLQKLTTLDIQKYYNEMLKSGRYDKKGGLSPNTIRRHHACIHKSLDYAIKMQLIIKNPSENVELPKKNKFKSISLTTLQVQKLLLACKNTRMEIPINLAIGLGLRRSEICGLKWEDIDFDNNKISIKEARIRVNKEDIIKDPKSESGIRTLIAEKPLIELLKKEKIKQNEQKLSLGKNYKKNDFVFRNEDGNTISPSTLSHLFEKFIKNKTDIKEKVRLHDLRHTNITLMLKSGVPYKVVQRRAGHSDINILFNTYGHTIEEMEQMAIDNVIYKEG